MRFDDGRGKRGPFKTGTPAGWEWSRDGGDYSNHRDFFRLHWEVHDHDPASVKLHVESPRFTVDPILNDLKRKVIEALLTAGIESVTASRGLKLRRGRRVSTAQIQQNKSTEPFRIVLSNDQRLETPEGNILHVHNTIGPSVKHVVDRFCSEIDAQFGT